MPSWTFFVEEKPHISFLGSFFLVHFESSWYYFLLLLQTLEKNKNKTKTKTKTKTKIMADGTLTKEPFTIEVLNIEGGDIEGAPPIVSFRCKKKGIFFILILGCFILLF